VKRLRVQGRSATRANPSIVALSTVDQQVLAGTYTDSDVESMAGEDGRAQFFTNIWGRGNREPRAIRALNHGAEVSRSLILHDLYSTVLAPQLEIEVLKAKVPILAHNASVAVSELSEAQEEVGRIQRTCQENDLPLPEHHLRRAIAEISIYVALVIGDLMFITAAYQVFGLSDQSVGFVPFSPLQLASSSTVVALLILTRLVGRFSRQLSYLTELSSIIDTETPDGFARQARSTKRLRFTIAAATSAVAGVLAILVGLSLVRSSYLAQLHVPSNFLEFFLIQTGIAAAGCVTSYWAAHPLEHDWRAANRHLQRAHKFVQRSQTSYADSVGNFNGLLRTLESVTSQHRVWADATMFDAARKAEIYARRLQHAQPEPTDDALLPAALPRPASATRAVPPQFPSVARDVTRSEYQPITVDLYIEHLNSHQETKPRAPTVEPLFPIRNQDAFTVGKEVVGSSNGSGSH